MKNKIRKALNLDGKFFDIRMEAIVETPNGFDLNFSSYDEITLEQLQAISQIFVEEGREVVIRVEPECEEGSYMYEPSTGEYYPNLKIKIRYKETQS